jgi:hypothetical protein
MRNIKYFFLGVVLLAASCKKKDLDRLDLLTTEPRVISASAIVAADITKDVESVKIPFKITLSGPATKAFQVGVTLNNDTVTQLISNGTLQNTVLASSGSVYLPNVIDVAYGQDTASGMATVQLTELERNYGKNIAFVIRLTNPGKGNIIEASKSSILVVINTTQIMTPADIHYLSISNGGGSILNVEYKKNYFTTPGGATIPLIINLANQASGPFNVGVKLNRDTIATLVNNGTLPPNTIHLKPDEFSIDTMIRVNSNSNTAQINLSIPWSVFDANIVANQNFAFSVTLSDPTKHVLHPTKHTVIVLVNPSVNLDNNSYITGKGTGLKAEYFTNNQMLDFDGRTATLVRVDGTIDFGGDWLPTTISRDNFSSRWTGEFLAPVRGEYIFYQTRWDDGSRLFVNGKAIIDDFTTEWDKASRNGRIFLERGQRYKIEARHRENVGGQQARLEYEVPSVGIVGKRIVPRTQLYPAP